MKSFKEIDGEGVIKALKQFGQGENHSEVAVLMEKAMAEEGVIAVDVIKHTNDYAITRVCEGRSIQYFLVGFLGSGETGVFSHQLPLDGMVYEEVEMQRVLDFINRSPEGFRRVQGDVIVRQVGIVDPIRGRNDSYDGRIWDSEISGEVTIGNSHRVRGIFPWAKRLPQGIQGANFMRMSNIAVYADQFNPIQINHPEHNFAEISSAVPAMFEITTQKTEGSSQYAAD